MASLRIEFMKNSKLWDSLSRTLFTDLDIESFRQPGGANDRLATWPPEDPRWFKFMLFYAALNRSEKFFESYAALSKTNTLVGNPITVTVKGLKIDLDYLLGVEEYLFLSESLTEASSPKSIIEIGAGFGRTCHTMLHLFPRIESYTIVDLPSMLALSKPVLSRSIPQHLDRIRFVDATNPSAWQGLSADVAINIDSFQEMTPATIDGYMQGIVQNCLAFYSKNAVGKYTPQSVLLPVNPKQPTEDVFELGYCRDVIDIFDDAALEAARLKYLMAYAPAATWVSLRDKQCTLFPYFHHAVWRAKTT